jgi:hypothetical protein
LQSVRLHVCYTRPMAFKKMPTGTKDKSHLVMTIRAIRAQIAELKGELAEAMRELREELDEAPSVTQTAPAPQPRPRPLHPHQRRGLRRVEARSAEVLPQGSAAYHAAMAVRAVGHPLHVRDLLRAMDDKGIKIKQTTLVGSLSRWVARRVFYRAGPNVFGLAEMRE